MKRDYKKLYIYAAVMLVSVLLIVLIACLSESRIDSYQMEYENMITASQGEIGKLEKKVAKLESENHELRESNEVSMTAQATLDKQNQVMNELVGIYRLAKDGKTAEAKEAYEHIDTGGYDDAALALWEIIGEYIK